MTDFPSSNNTATTATNLGYLSRYRLGGSINFVRNDSVGAGTGDAIDYFRFASTTGLNRIAITISMEKVDANVLDYIQELQILPGANFTSGQRKAIFQTAGAYEDGLVNSDPRNQFDTFSMRFVFNVAEGSTFNTFAIRGAQQEYFSYENLNYTVKVEVWREYDVRNKINGTNANDVLRGTNTDDVILARGGNDLVRAGRQNDFVRGDNGNDRIYGDHGHDRLDGGNGNDLLVGGLHNDTILGGNGRDRAFGDNGNDFIRGGNHNDFIRGGSGNDRIFGDAGHDRILGDAGRDLIRGGTGNDFIRGGTDNDRIFGDAGVDRILGDGGNDIIYGGTENDLLRGGTGADTILGEEGDDTIFGDDQNDELLGGTGADYLNGGDGNDLINPGGDLDADTIIGGAGSDTVDYSDAPSRVFVFLPSSGSSGYATGDTFDSIENVIGTRFDDGLQPTAGGIAYGGDGDDTLYGAGNFDSRQDGGIIRGDEGADTLNMQYGDTKAWVQFYKGADTIDHFVEGQDKIFVDLADFGYSRTYMQSSDITNSNTVQASGSAGHFIFEGDAQRLWYDIDGIGAQTPLLIATFTNSTFDETGTPALDINDFDWIF